MTCNGIKKSTLVLAVFAQGLCPAGAGVAEADDHVIMTFEDLQAAAGAAVDGDRILFAADITFADIISIDRSVEIGLQDGRTSATLTTSGRDLLFESQATGTEISIFGPITINSSDGTALMGTATSGPLSMIVRNVSTTAALGYGMRFDTVSSFPMTATIAECTANDNHNEGFAAYSTGSGLTRAHLWHCIAERNHVGADVNDDGATMWIVGGRYWDNQLRSFVALPDSRLFVSGAHANRPVAFAQYASGSIDDSTFDFTCATAEGVGFLFLGGTDVSLRNCTFNLSHDMDPIFHIAGNEAVFSNCTFNLTMESLTGTMIYVKQNRSLTLANCAMNTGSTAIVGQLVSNDGTVNLNYFDWHFQINEE